MLLKLDKLMPREAVPFFFIKIFSTFGYAVLYSSLVLYITKDLQGSVSQATGIMGVFIAFNFILHLFGGYIGGRFLSYRALFVTGIILEFIGTIFIAQSSMTVFYIGLSIFLTGCGIYVTSVNCILTQQFKPEDTKREKAFFWVYSGMNVGFFLGIAVAGYYHISNNYHQLFVISATTSILSLLLFVANWVRMRDIETPLSKLTSKQQKSRLSVSIILTALMIPSLWFMLQHTALSNNVVLMFGGCMLLTVLRMAYKQKSLQERHKLIAFLVFMLSAIVFWSLFFIAPIGLMVFIKYHVSDTLLGMKFPPQWFGNVNTLVVVFFGPVLAVLFQRLRDKGFNVTVPIQFTFALLFMAAAYLVLPLGIKFSSGAVSGAWVIAYYALQSIGELFIAPVGYAMIGQLVPVRIQGIMMGTWMMVSGVASSLSHSLSSAMIHKSASGVPPIEPFSHSFNVLGVTVIGFSIILMLLTPKLNKLMGLARNNQTDTEEAYSA